MKDIEEQLGHRLGEYQRIASRWPRIKARMMRTDLITVYCDCSARMDGNYGLGVCLLTAGSYMLFAKQFQDVNRPRHTAGAEMRALQFALECSVSTIQHTSVGTVNKVLVLSDLQFAARLVSRRRQPDLFPSFRKVLDDIDEVIVTLQEHYNVTVEVNYLVPPGQQGNPFYIAAHQASRWAASNQLQTNNLAEKFG